MSLLWLKYVAYLSLAAALFLFWAVRFNRLGLSRRLKLLLYCGCVALACLAWHVQVTYSEEYSPRKLVMGPVASVSTVHHRNGSVGYEFQLKLDGGLSPKYSADFVPSYLVHRPLYQGDVVGVLYRTWDDVAVTVDELEGHYPGWHYRKFEDHGNGFVLGVAVAGALALLNMVLPSLFVTTLRMPTKAELGVQQKND